MTDATTAMVDTDTITVEDGFNPRRDIDPDRLAELEASIRETGIVSALTVRHDGDGGYTLIAGERRLRAARNAGITTVPVVIRPDGGALAAAIAENLIRHDLDPIEEANALRRLAKAEKLNSHKALAARVGKSANWVSERLRLLKLPEGAQAQIASGAVPIAAERELRAVAAVSPRVAECACELAARGDVEGRDLVERFGEILVAVARAEFEPAPTLIELGQRVQLSALVAAGERRDALAARARAVKDPYGYPAADDPWLAVAGDDIDAARAAGCLIEHVDDDGGWQHRLWFVTDRELAADLAERMVERAERNAAERQTGRSESPTQLASPEDDKEARRRERAEARADAEAARTFNLNIGRKLIARRGAKTRSAHALARAKAVAAILLADNDRLAAAGLRLVLPQLQEVTVTQLKSTGESREKVAYAEPDDCLTYLRSQIERAKSANEVLELLADALIAAHLADSRELPQSRRIPGWHGAMDAAAKLMADDIKAVKPRRAKQAS